MRLSNQILNQLALYLGEKLSLSEFRDWEVPMFLRRDTLSDDDRKFLFEFERHYGELAHGLPEATFKSMLRSLAVPSVIDFPVMLETPLAAMASPTSSGSTSESRWNGVTGGSLVTLAELIPA